MLNTKAQKIATATSAREVMLGLGEKTVRARYLCWYRIWYSLSCSTSLDRVIISRRIGDLVFSDLRTRNSAEEIADGEERFLEIEILLIK